MSTSSIIYSFSWNSKAPIKYVVSHCFGKCKSLTKNAANHKASATRSQKERRANSNVPLWGIY